MRVLLFACCFLVTAVAAAAEPKQVLLLGQGPDNHPAGTHEYRQGLELLGKLLEESGGIKVRQVVADDPWPDGPKLIEGADGVVMFLAEGARWTQADPRRQEALAKLAARGGGLVSLHWALGTRAAEPIDGFLKLLGGCHGGPDRKYQVLETDVSVVDRHPITIGIDNFRVRDEFYYRLKFVQPASVRSLLTAKIDGQDETVAWAWERPDGGRSFGFTGLHFHDNWKLPEYQKLVTQGVRWTVKLE